MANLNSFITSPLTTGTTTVDGTTATLLFTSTAADHYVYEIRVQPLGQNNRCRFRVWLNDGAGTAAANFVMIGEYQLDDSPDIDAEAVAPTIIPIRRYLVISERIYVAITKDGNAGWDVSCLAGDYDAFRQENALG